MRPSAAQIKRGAYALGPFVHRWGLLANPEDLEEMAYAVLRNYDRQTRGQRGWEVIQNDVNKQLDEVEAKHRKMLDAMQQAIDERGGSVPQAESQELPPAYDYEYRIVLEHPDGSVVKLMPQGSYETTKERLQLILDDAPDNYPKGWLERRMQSAGWETFCAAQTPRSNL